MEIESEMERLREENEELLHSQVGPATPRLDPPRCVRRWGMPGFSLA